MKLSALLVLAFALVGCSQSEEDHARAQARQTAEQLKRDSQKALHTAEVDARKADAELTHGLERTREKARRALNQPEDKDSR
jgi:predicted lipoprotein